MGNSNYLSSDSTFLSGYTSPKYTGTPDRRKAKQRAVEKGLSKMGKIRRPGKRGVKLMLLFYYFLCYSFFHDGMV